METVQLTTKFCDPCWNKYSLKPDNGPITSAFTISRQIIICETARLSRCDFSSSWTAFLMLTMFPSLTLCIIPLFIDGEMQVLLREKKPAQALSTGRRRIAVQSNRRYHICSTVNGVGRISISQLLQVVTVKTADRIVNPRRTLSNGTRHDITRQRAVHKATATATGIRRVFILLDDHCAAVKLQNPVSGRNGRVKK